MYSEKKNLPRTIEHEYFHIFFETQKKYILYANL